MLRPPSNPRPLAPLPTQRTDGGAVPGPPALARARAQQRTAVVAADLTLAEQVAFDRAAEAFRLQNAGSGPTRPRAATASCRPASGLLVEDRAAYGGLANLRVDPSQAGPEAFPYGFIAPQARAGSDPEPRINWRMKRRVSGL